MEPHAEKWLIKARTRAEQGMLDRAVSEELFDHTWMASIYQLQKNLRIADGQKLLDAGCGWGRLIFGIKYFHRSVTIDGYELTAEFANKAREILEHAGLHEGVRIIEGDLLGVTIPEGHYDSFYSSRVLHYIDRKEVVLEKLYACLKQHGIGMVILPNRWCPYRWLTYRHAPLYPITCVGQMMECIGFKNVYYGGYGFIPALKRFAYDSMVAGIERYLSATRFRKFGGLAYVVGQK
jgi:ubiquinone/menaquinone biosynthesis C-methylase UbiE